jgi:hypothetical protein
MEETKTSKRYVPPPAKPEGFDQALTLIGGRNPYGEPNLRVSWGWDLRTFRNGNPNALKYPGPGLERWILEKWTPPSFFGSPKQWEQHRYFYANGQRIDALGDFPSRGMYTLSQILCAAGLHGTKPGDFIPLSSDVLNYIEMLQQEFNSRTLNVYSSAKDYRRLQDEMAREEELSNQETEREADALGDYISTHQEEINRNPVFSFPNKSIWTPTGEHLIH